MTVCILGNSLTALTLAKTLVNYKINVDLFFFKKNFKIDESKPLVLPRITLIFLITI